MAKYNVTHRCGHSVEHNITDSSPHYEVERRALQLCAECYSKSGDEPPVLPTLQGSDKQVAWALDIRAHRMQEITDTRKLIEGNAAKDPGNVERVLNIIRSIEQQTSAAWWIDHRNDTAQMMVREMYS